MIHWFFSKKSILIIIKRVREKAKTKFLFFRPASPAKRGEASADNIGLISSIRVIFVIVGISALCYFSAPLTLHHSSTVSTWQKEWAPIKIENKVWEKINSWNVLEEAINWKTLNKVIEKPFGNFGNFFLLLNFSSKISEKEKNIAEFLYFNPKMNSGWFYIAQTIPEKGIAFWAAIIRTFSAQQTDKSAYLLYGIIDENAKCKKENHEKRDEKQNIDFQFHIATGSFFEAQNKVNLFFKNNSESLKFYQTKAGLSEFKLNVDLSWPLSCPGQSREQGENKNRFQINKTLNLNQPIIYESGDGIIPMGQGVDSLYVSLPLEQGFWVDFQKFNIPFNSAIIQPLYWKNIKPNHYWASFILSENVGSLPAGTRGVYWEIFDQKGNRQPGGYTNFDLLIPGKPQQTVGNFQIEKYEYSQAFDAGKKYLKKWRIVQKDLGVDLIFETLTDSANCDIQLSSGLPQSPHTMDFNFYEGMTKVFAPLQPEKQVGTGMLEQTHNEEQK